MKIQHVRFCVKVVLKKKLFSAGLQLGIPRLKVRGVWGWVCKLLTTNSWESQFRCADHKSISMKYYHKVYGSLISENKDRWLVLISQAA